MKLTHTLLLGTLVISSQPALANIDIVFNYDYDSSNYFTDVNRQNLLNSAAAVFETRFKDTLSAITSSDGNHFDATFFNPSSGASTTRSNYSVAADKIVVFVGAYDLGTNTLGQGGPGGFGASGSADFLNTVQSRGELGALGEPNTQTDFGPWGGSLSFDSGTSFYFDTDITTDADISNFDFYSVAVHELGHLLGFGTAASFSNRVSGSVFNGPAVTALTGAGQAVTLDGHWQAGLSYGGQETAMDPDIASGTRKRFTELDFAALADTGWEVSPVPEAETWGMLLAGLGLLGWRMRART